MRGGIFITGTDTGVGKTWVTTQLVRELIGRGLRAVGMKPVECGGREDAIAIRRASGEREPLDRINPVFLDEPLAPAAAAQIPDIDFARIGDCFGRLTRAYDLVLVEGAGGWLVPLDRERTMADLAIALDLPVILIARNRLGVLNHTLLTVRALAASGRACRAIYLNTLPSDRDGTDCSRSSNARVLRELLPGIPVIEDDLSLLATSLF